MTVGVLSIAPRPNQLQVTLVTCLTYELWNPVSVRGTIDQLATKTAWNSCLNGIVPIDVSREQVAVLTDVTNRAVGASNECGHVQG
jgi:hypothetical protein